MKQSKLLSANAVRQTCGDISDMTIWRWLHDDALNFPKPIYISKRRYWREAEILEWINSRGLAA